MNQETKVNPARDKDSTAGPERLLAPSSHVSGGDRHSTLLTSPGALPKQRIARRDDATAAGESDHGCGEMKASTEPAERSERWKQRAQEIAVGIQIRLDPGLTYVRLQKPGGQFLHVDPGFEHLTGHEVTRLEEDAGLWDQLLSPEDEDTVQQAYGQAMSAAGPASLTYTIQRPGSDGAEQARAVAETFQVLMDSEIGLIRVGRIVDRTELVQAERRLAAEKERLELVLHGTRLGLWDWNMQTGETRFNDRWAEIVGYSLSELEPTSIDTWMRLANPDDLTGSEELIEKHANGELEYYDVEARMKHKDGHWVWVHDRGRIVEWTIDGKPLRMTGTHEDITTRKHQQAQLELHAETDPLTGLGNRRQLDREIDARLERGEDFGLCLLDLDDFKSINDTFGHLAGDAVLQAVGEALRSQSRPIDLPIRYAGDEFVVLLPEADLETITNIATRIRKAVTRLVPTPDSRRLGVSAGSVASSQLPVDRRTRKDVIELADERLYCAKSRGGNLLCTDIDQPD